MATKMGEVSKKDLPKEMARVLGIQKYRVDMHHVAEEKGVCDRTVAGDELERYLRMLIMASPYLDL